MTDPTAPRDHPRLTRYTPYVNGAAFMGMLRQNAMHPETFGPDFDWTHGPYVLASEADAEIERLTRENANLFDALKQLGADNLVLCASRSRLEAALSTLLDEQNGPPLIRRRKEWEAACQQAREALNNG